MPLRLLIAALLSSALHLPSQVEWRRLSPGLSARQSHAVAFDAARGRTVLFGGRAFTVSSNESEPVDDTWVWDGARWSQMSPPSPPAARYSHAMAYDMARQRVVLFGGRGSLVAPNVFSDTWEWNGTLWTACAPASSPPARYLHGMTYDWSRGRVVVFGGSDTRGQELGDTWEWDGVNWSQRATSGGPTPRYGPAITYDWIRARLVLFGGTTQAGALGDTWEMDATGWTQMNPASAPPPRGYAPFAFVPGSWRSTLFGGATPDELWEWDGRVWLLRKMATAPTGFSRTGVAWDSVRQRAVVFATAQGSDTWEWDGNAWAQREVAAVPEPRPATPLVHDASRDRTVMFGGLPWTTVGDTWEWDGLRWARRQSAQSPVGRTGHGLAYDSGRQRVVLFGGSAGSQETWEWDGAGWANRTAGAAPSARARHAMTYDAAAGRVLLFGGQRLTTGGPAERDTWEWDGQGWTQRAPATSPPARYGHSLVYDSARRRAVLFGGQSPQALGDTWEWDGTNWKQLQPAHSPPAMFGSAMAYDAFRERVVLFGGYAYSSPAHDGVWEWDGLDWTRRTVPWTPTGRSDAGLVYSNTRRCLVLYGGTATGGYQLLDTWEYSTLMPASSAAFGGVCFGSGGVPRLTADRLPWLGDTVRLTLGFGGSGNLCALLLGGSKSSWAGVPLPMSLSKLGLGGCLLYTSVDAVLSAPIVAGQAAFPLALPSAGIAGADVYAQVLLQDPSYGHTVTEALAMRMGAR